MVDNLPSIPGSQDLPALPLEEEVAVQEGDLVPEVGKYILANRWGNRYICVNATPLPIVPLDGWA